MRIEDSAARPAAQAKSAINPSSWFAQLTIHPAAGMFPMLDESELAALAADIEAHGLREPVVFFDDEPAPEPADAAAAARLWQRKRNLQLPLLDGRNRLAAMDAAGLLTETAIADIVAKARIVRGDPVSYVLSTNLHRRHLTRDQRRELIAKLLEDNPNRSDRAIAAMAKVSHPTVAAVRAEMALDGDMLPGATGKSYQFQKATSSPPSPEPERRVGLDGKARALPTRPAAPASAPQTQAVGLPAVIEAAASGGHSSRAALEEGRAPTKHDIPKGAIYYRSAGTGEVEWYTPAPYIEAARAVLGEIDLDPASHPVAQRTVRATKFFTAEDDGLAHPWHGRVWLNPPYARGLIEKFIKKLIGEFTEQRVSEAILLTHNSTDTSWFHDAERCAARICFTRGRIAFVHVTGDECSPAQGQAFFYYGANAEKFDFVFSRFGFVRQPIRQLRAA